MDIALKQRLVGASVLIALAVIVLPMLLGGRPEERAQGAQKIELPPEPAELDFQTRRYPLGEMPSVAQREPDPEPIADAGAPAATGVTAPQAPAESAAGAVTHVEIQPRASVDALAESGERPEPEPVAAAPASQQPATPVAAAGDAGSDSAERYVVQVASFGSVANAQRLADALRGQGYTVLSDTVSSDVGTLHRVRVGPFGTEAEASATVARVADQIADVKPRVVDLQPEKTAQVTTPSDPLVRWVVQVGSFGSADNADALIGRLRGEGFSAYREAVSTGEATIYRVRVGPFVERDEAIRVDEKIAERLSLDGVVMSAD